MTIGGHEFKPADKASVSRLTELARQSLDTGDSSVADAAAVFLGSYRITEEMFSTEELLRFLKSDRTLRIHAGLSGLTARNRIRDAIPWLLDRMRKNDPQLESYYRRFLSSLHGDIEDWERGVLIHLLEADPLEALETISVHGVSRRLGKLPEEWAAILRGYLNEQLTDKRKQWWAEEAERDKRGQLEPDHEVNCQALSEGIRLLDTLNDPADVPLLQSLLEHPAANSNAYHDGSSTLFFAARMTAKECLQRRKIAVPDSVVTRIGMKPPLPPRDRMEDFMRYVLTHEFAIMGVSLAVFVGACMTFRRTRTRRTVVSK